MKRRLFEDIIDNSEINWNDDEQTSRKAVAGNGKNPIVKGEGLDPDRFNVRIDFLLTVKKDGKVNLDNVDRVCEVIDEYIWK